MLYIHHLCRADRSNYDSHDSDSWQWSQFDKDTADTLLRVLTAKAVKRLLHELMELDQFKAQWFNNYCSEHPPADGDKVGRPACHTNPRCRLAKSAATLSPNESLRFSSLPSLSPASHCSHSLLGL